ncbi:hypothetical protein QN366_08800 [Pseudomonas sp. CCC3.2]|uniref:hypothetical protein n=1 Tax=unclassified Pseudomonas TaxID=196821 RepID=UPI002AB3CA3D|nr:MULTISPECIES: hypothetical protein [unclassified Pseudomonas]MDY7558977.1 hypothetical protein [Pseudomonas sp. AB6]MEB0180165.1 hypothetical protein [Pseudomonas sp. CCC3.2]MEB0209045.1 hypothetical protein [Pseudomonas sp. AB6]
MDGHGEFVIYSDFREGYLTQTNPSVWHYSEESAIRFETEKEARTAAARRHGDDAQAGRLVRVDGTVEFEALRKIERALPGSWIVTITDAQSPGRPYYLMNGGQVVKMATPIDDAKGYRFERDAMKAVDSINKGGALTAQTHQKTAQILSFPVA